MRLKALKSAKIVAGLLNISGLALLQKVRLTIRNCTLKHERKAHAHSTNLPLGWNVRFGMPFLGGGRGTLNSRRKNIMLLTHWKAQFLDAILSPWMEHQNDQKMVFLKSLNSGQVSYIFTWLKYLCQKKPINHKRWNTTLFTVNFCQLHYNINQLVWKAISYNIVVSAQTSVISMLGYILN